MKPATSLCCLRRSVEYRRCTTTSPPTATSIATATMNRPVIMRIILEASLRGSRLLVGSTLSSEEHNAIDAWLPRTSENPQNANFAFTEFSAPLCQAALREGDCESAMRLLKTASEMRLLRHRSASFRDLPSAIFLP